MLWMAIQTLILYVSSLLLFMYRRETSIWPTIPLIIFLPLSLLFRGYWFSISPAPPFCTLYHLDENFFLRWNLWFYSCFLKILPIRTFPMSLNCFQFGWNLVCGVMTGLPNRKGFMGIWNPSVRKLWQVILILRWHFPSDIWLPSVSRVEHFLVVRFG